MPTTAAIAYAPPQYSEMTRPAVYPYATNQNYGQLVNEHRQGYDPLGKLAKLKEAMQRSAVPSIGLHI
jgi:hypothetical protein